ncbi:MAG: hypothetical protein NPIRA04_10600 [Nitrospirales bacterium]|nr:MAG: hypothetical protein NPIRA04_10600 [Nitrospirales bacterium]
MQGDASLLANDMIDRIITILTKVSAIESIQEKGMHSYHLHEFKGRNLNI